MDDLSTSPKQEIHLELIDDVEEANQIVKKTTHTPWWSYVALAIAVLAMSSGGIWFALLGDATPPLMQACWRLTLTSFLQLFGLVYQWNADKTVDRGFWQRVVSSWFLLTTVGLSLAIHFGSWGWSIAHTSLLDSLLLVSSVPLLLVFVMVLRWIFRRSYPVQNELIDRKESSWFYIVCCPLVAFAPTWLEGIGALLGFLGVLVLLLVAPQESSSTRNPSSLAGNLAALLCAVSIIIYLEGGAYCRRWMPLYIYALPVTFIAALFLAIGSLVFEPTSTYYGIGPTALFGFLGSNERFAYAFGAAAVSGIAGHTMANLAMKYVSPLLVGVAVLWEPLLESVLGYFVGVQDPPDLLSLTATPLLLGGALLVTLGGRNSTWRAPCCQR